jgi:branched-chain amino acid transport system ATP-binding protein
MLTVRDLHVGYDGNNVLGGIDVDVEEGDLVALIGPNGAGKTTLLNTISGLNRPSRGTIRFYEKDITSLSPDAIVRLGIIHVPEGRMVLGRMSVRENLLLGAFTRRQDQDMRRDLERVLALFPILDERIDQVAGTLSGGEQQMLAIARGLMGAPRLIMLDEPSLGIAPLIVDRIFAAIRDIRADGVTVLLVEQNASKALEAADKGYALELGRITASGAASGLLADENVRRAYLGV